MFDGRHPGSLCQVNWRKVVGAAAFLGVATTGVVIVRAERRRRAYTPEEVRARLHARVAEAIGTRTPPDQPV